MKFLFTGFTIEQIQVGRHKTKLLMVQKHTFAQTTRDPRYWNCSRKNTVKCPAKLRFDDSGKLIFYEIKHNHPPPRLFKSSDGSYVKF